MQYLFAFTNIRHLSVFSNKNAFYPLFYSKIMKNALFLAMCLIFMACKNDVKTADATPKTNCSTLEKGRQLKSKSVERIFRTPQYFY